MISITKLIFENNKYTTKAIKASTLAVPATFTLGGMEGIGALGQYHARRKGKQAVKDLEINSNDKDAQSRLTSSYIDHQTSGTFRPFSRILGKGSYDSSNTYTQNVDPDGKFVNNIGSVFSKVMNNVNGKSN